MVSESLTVVLWTYNRFRSLANKRESLAACELPDTIEWEVLVVATTRRTKVAK